MTMSRVNHATVNNRNRHYTVTFLIIAVLLYIHNVYT